MMNARAVGTGTTEMSKVLAHLLYTSSGVNLGRSRFLLNKPNDGATTTSATRLLSLNGKRRVVSNK